MNFKTIFTAIIVVTFVSVGLSKKIQKKVFKEIKDTYQIDDFEFNAITFSEAITKELPSKFGENNFFEIVSEDKKVGYAYVAKAPSKTAEFDYLILLDINLHVKKAKVLIYREEYGGEIGSKRWLKQFVGKTPKDELKYQENIVAISGATISVRSMTNAVNDLLRSLEVLQNKKSL